MADEKEEKKQDIIEEQDVPIVETNENPEHSVSTAQESVELDLDKYGAMEVHSGGGKPEFAKLTKMKVKSAVLMTMPERKQEKDKKGNMQTYYPVFLKVTCDFNGSEIYENYGGGKLYVSDKNGESRFWLGENSAFGKLKSLVEDNFEFSGILKDIPELLSDQEVGVKTEATNVSGIEYRKNIIQVFYK